MTVFILPGPDKLQMKASSDNHQSFLLFYLTFFQEERSFSDSKHIEPQQQFSYHNLFPKIVRCVESQA